MAHKYCNSTVVLCQELLSWFTIKDDCDYNILTVFQNFKRDQHFCINIEEPESGFAYRVTSDYLQGHKSSSHFKRQTRETFEGGSNVRNFRKCQCKERIRLLLLNKQSTFKFLFHLEASRIREFWPLLAPMDLRFGGHSLFSLKRVILEIWQELRLKRLSETSST